MSVPFLPVRILLAQSVTRMQEIPMLLLATEQLILLEDVLKQSSNDALAGAPLKKSGAVVNANVSNFPGHGKSRYMRIAPKRTRVHHGHRLVDDSGTPDSPKPEDATGRGRGVEGNSS